MCVWIWMQFGIVFLYFTRLSKYSRRAAITNTSILTLFSFNRLCPFLLSLFHVVRFWFLAIPHRRKIDDTESITIFSHRSCFTFVHSIQNLHTVIKNVYGCMKYAGFAANKTMCYKFSIELTVISLKMQQFQ